MSRTKLHALAGVSLLAATALAGAANALTTVNGGGSSLLAPYFAQAVDCYDSDNTTYDVKGASATAPQVTMVTPAKSPGVTCSPTTGFKYNYDSTGSGTGQLGLFSHDAVIGTNLSSTGAVTASTAIDFGSATSAGTTEVFPSIQYGLSDNSLVGTDLAVFDVGTSPAGGPAVTLTTSYNGDSATYTSPTSYQASTFTSSGTPHNGGTGSTVYPIAKSRYGQLVQFPVSVDPVALGYNAKYKSSNGNTYSFNVNKPNGDGSGGLKLNSTAYCAIFTGGVTSWFDPSLTTLNGGVSLKNPNDTGTSAPITIVGRTDSSGTTSIFTRHLAAICTGTSAKFGSAGTTTLPAAVTGLSNFVGGSGSGGVAAAINANPGAIGYIGPDYVLPAVVNTGANTYNLNVADLSSSTTTSPLPTFIEPTSAAALTSFGSLLPPQSGSNGAYNASTSSDRRDPTQWVQSTSATAALAKPPVADYPIVGTTNFIAYTCYATAGSVTALNNILQYGGGSQAKTILSNAGLSQLPLAWTTAILNTFLETSGDAKSLNLFFAKAGSTSTNTNCTSAVGG